MLTLTISPPLAQEFASVQALWVSDAETRRVDALLLTWVKYEKQLRRLFCFLVFQHPNISEKQIDLVISTMAENRRLYPETFVRAINALGVEPVPKLIGTRHAELHREILRIQKYRNKLMHGQLTGLSISSRQLEVDVRLLIDWIDTLAQGAHAAFGYDGLGRKTFEAAKCNSNIAVAEYPFASAESFGEWLDAVAQ